MEKFTALVVDDERLARQKLIAMLSKYESIEVIGEAFDVNSAKKCIETSVPDILFLDIQMPKKSGFDLIEQIAFEGKIVFVTAFDEYAVKAFEINALDYLLKPVSEERLDKLILKLEQKDEEKEVIIKNISKLSYTDKIFVSDNKVVKFVNIREISAIQSVGNYSKVILSSGEKLIIYKTLKEWSLRLPENKFVRIHRTAIVNIDYISKMEKWFNYSFRIFISGIETPFVVSKSFTSELKERFS
ncbi:MAG: LytR/AlgR family response regulator transcription factor [Bacteroidales bacterium]